MVDNQAETLSPSQPGDKCGAIFTTFYNFLEYYEKWKWDGRVSDVKNAFKAAQLCESIYKDLAQEDRLQHFNICLPHLLSNRFSDSVSKKYDIHFFRKSCDVLLEKFLRSEKMPSNEMVRQAIVSYISLCSEERCSRLIDKLLAESVLFKSVCDIKDLVNCKSETCKKNIGIDILHQKLLQFADPYNIDNFKEVIKNSLIHGTIHSYLHTNFGNMDAINTEVEIKNLLLKTLLEILQESADLRRRFWKVDSQSELDLFARIANNHPDFLCAMLDLIQKEGQSMTMTFDDKFQPSWKSTEHEVFTYDELIALIKCLVNSEGDARNKTKTFLLSNADNDEDGMSFWSLAARLLVVMPSKLGGVQ